jgi:hypothetical protein
MQLSQNPGKVSKKVAGFSGFGKLKTSNCNLDPADRKIRNRIISHPAKLAHFSTAIDTVRTPAR